MIEDIKGYGRARELETNHLLDFYQEKVQSLEENCRKEIERNNHMKEKVTSLEDEMADKLRSLEEHMDEKIAYAEKEKADQKVNLEGVIDFLKEKLVNLEALNEKDEMTIADLKEEILQLVEEAGEWTPTMIRNHPCPPAYLAQGIQDMH